jgi:hypothetical protein
MTPSGALPRGYCVMRPRARLPRDRGRATLLLAISGASGLATLMLLLAGAPVAALRAFSGAVLLLLLLLLLLAWRD